MRQSGIGYGCFIKGKNGPLWTVGYQDITKYDGLGNIVWCKTISTTTESYSCTVDHLDNLLVGHYRYFAVSKFDTNGDLLWYKRFDTNVSSAIKSITVDNSGCIYVSGQLSTAVGVVMKLDPNGTLLWSVSSAAISHDNITYEFYSDTVTVVSTIGTVSPFSAAMINFSAATGVVNWERTFTPAAGTTDIVAGTVSADAAGNIYATFGQNSSTLGGYTCAVYKYSSAGTLLWSKYYVNSVAISISFGYPTITTPDTNTTEAYLSIYSSAAGGSASGFVKIDSANGNILTNIKVTPQSGGNTLLYSHVASDGTIALRSTGTLGIIKIPSDGSITGTFNSEGLTPSNFLTIGAGTFTTGTIANITVGTTNTHAHAAAGLALQAGSIPLLAASISNNLAVCYIR
jgi:hypothetical protein